MLVNALVISHLDYCNCLLYGIPKYLRNKLQRLQKYRGVSCDGSKTFRSCDAYTNWLTVEKRIEFNILLITHKTIHAQSADWLKPLSEMYQPSWSLKQENNKNEEEEEEEEEVNNNCSVYSRGAHPPGICREFVILFWKSCKCPTEELRNRVQMPHPGTTPKLYFPLKKLQIKYLWEISINLLIKTREAPKVNRP